MSFLRLHGRHDAWEALVEVSWQDGRDEQALQPDAFQRLQTLLHVKQSVLDNSLPDGTLPVGQYVAIRIERL